jgi:hypothetical protein
MAKPTQADAEAAVRVLIEWHASKYVFETNDGAWKVPSEPTTTRVVLVRVQPSSSKESVIDPDAFADAGRAAVGGCT